MSNELDRKIRQALSAEDAKILDSFDEEPGILGLTAETLSGKFRLVNGAGFVVMFVMMIGTVYCFWQLYMTDAADIKALISWSVGGSLLFLGVSGMKIWFWMLINRNDTVREIKRLEFKVTSLLTTLESTK